MSRIDNAKRGLLAGVINNFLAIVLPFISRTVLIYTLGTEYVGLGGLFTSIISVLSISELGFGSAVSYILYKPVAEGDDEKVRSVLRFTRKCFRVIGLIIFAAGLGIMPFLKFLIKDDVPADINIYILFFLYLVNVVISYLMFAYKRLLFSANQRYDAETTITSCTLLLQYVLQIGILLLTKNYYLFVSVFVVMTALNNLLCHLVTKRMYPQYFCQGDISKEEVSFLKKKIGGSFFSKVGETVYLSVDNIVISVFFGLLVLGQYGNYYYVVTSLIALFAVIHNTLRPILGNCIVLEGKAANFRRLSVFSHLYFWLSAFCSCCLLCLYQDFIAVWVGSENQLDFIIALLLAVYFLVGRLGCIPTLFVEAAGLWWESKHIAMTAALLNLTLNIILSLLIGLPGVLISSIVCSLLVTFVGYTRVLFRHYFGSEGNFKGFLVQIGLSTAGAMLCISAVYFIVCRIPASNLFFLILKAALVAVLFFVLYLILNVKGRYSREAFRMVKRMLLSKMSRKSESEN